MPLALSGCSEQAWNNPHPQAESGQNILYSNFAERPKHLDPARSYSSDESRFIDQIYEPPLDYHYLKRPYELIPNTLTAMPEIRYSDANGNEVAADSPAVAFSTYHFAIKPGIVYQPHPAFARNEQGEPVYRFNSAAEAQAFSTIADFTYTGTQELRAEDYLYQIRRLADPKLLAPLRGLLSEYIVGMKEFFRAGNDRAGAAGSGTGQRRLAGFTHHSVCRIRTAGAVRIQHSLTRQIPTIQILAGVPFLCPHSGGSGYFLSPAGAGAAQYFPRLGIRWALAHS